MRMSYPLIQSLPNPSWQGGAGGFIRKLQT